MSNLCILDFSPLSPGQAWARPAAGASPPRCWSAQGRDPRLPPGLRCTCSDNISFSGTDFSQYFLSLWPFWWNDLSLVILALAPDIDGALIIAEQEELAGNNATLDYVINDNGTCTCKLCGEVTQSRTHWYRHKYKVKTTICQGAFLSWSIQVHNVCLFRCEKCEIFFKSKKGYEGHVANRHTPR